MNSMAMDTSLYFTQRNIQNVPVVPQEISNLKDEPKQVIWLKNDFFNLILLPDLKNIHQLLILLSGEHHIQIHLPPYHHTRHQNP